ncbi:HlyD family secretion protein [Gloeocapsopsis crepidinum]|uniref:biotin/lipoyl-binding protein n=1 Tax=Gloeocapsopsis crepidinum TaxID=693223 RepID=UPI001D144EEE|nr:biotin/lipoyl-binding protein [Gloeocapsopsis crepidinum]
MTTSTDIAVSKTLVRRAIRLSIAVLLAIGCLTPLIYWQFQSFQSRNLQPPLVKQPEIKTITALGRLEPEGEVIKLSAPTSAEGSRVEQLLVKEGDPIKVNQIIATLDNRVSEALP